MYVFIYFLPIATDIFFCSFLGMSRSNRAPPPFTRGTKAPLASVKAKNAPPPREQQKTISVGVADKGDKADPSKKRPTDVEGRDTNPKKHRLGKEPLVAKESRLPPPPPNLVTNMFAKLGHSMASKADMNSWATSSMEKNNAAITRRMT